MNDSRGTTVDGRLDATNTDNTVHRFRVNIGIVSYKYMT